MEIALRGTAGAMHRHQVSILFIRPELKQQLTLLRYSSEVRFPFAELTAEFVIVGVAAELGALEPPLEKKENPSNGDALGAAKKKD